jgi:hypothetical protein
MYVIVNGIHAVQKLNGENLIKVIGGLIYVIIYTNKYMK